MARLAAVLAIILLVSGLATGAPSCGSVSQELSPCITYLMRVESVPSETCCNGVKHMSKYSKKKKDRKAICECLRSMAGSVFGRIDISAISLIPGECGIKVKLPSISNDINCSKV